MPSIRKNILTLSLLILTIFISPLVRAEQETTNTPSIINPDSLQWHTFNAFPRGAEAAILSGDPRETGPFMLRVKIPPNYQIPPNWQTTKIFVTVLSGSYSIGVGNEFNSKDGKTLPSAGSVVIPANTHLYFWSREGAVLEVHGIGPWEIHYVNPLDDPRYRN